MIAPGRAQRPGAARGRIEAPTQEELDSCPFCDGREDRTPPETFALARAERAPNTPGWRVRVVPNLYPAFEHQEVVVHTPHHARSLAELDNEEVDLIAEVWHLRARAAAAAGFPYVHALVNEGREAGASLAHSHSQLVWMREPPPAVAAERPTAVAKLVAREDVRVAERDGVVALCHPAGRVPYELVVAPVQPSADGFADEQLGAALRLLADVLRRLAGIEGSLPVNAWLHARDHWHLEVFPRLTVLAGMELGAGIYVNTLAPEEAAQRLRDATPL